jgi:transcriptional regulator with XRE-family HTH domain
MLVENLIAKRHVPAMPKRHRARPGEGIPPEIKEEEGRLLHSIWRRRKKRTQAEFAEASGFTQGYVQQFFSGERPLTLEKAQLFAAELDVDIADFSPRLANELAKELESGVWPFQAFTRKDYTGLTKTQRATVENLVCEFLQANGAQAHPKVRKLA